MAVIFGETSMKPLPSLQAGIGSRSQLCWSCLSCDVAKGFTPHNNLWEYGILMGFNGI